jgi:hypothetical protein
MRIRTSCTRKRYPYENSTQSVSKIQFDTRDKLRLLICEFLEKKRRGKKYGGNFLLDLDLQEEESRRGFV